MLNWKAFGRSFLTRDRLLLLLLALLALLSAPRRRVAKPVARRVKPRPTVAPSRPTRQSALDQLRQAVRDGEALRGAILLDTWASEPPLRRPELQILLEEAARGAPELLASLAERLEALGVPLDWAQSNDCRANFGRYALDAALEVLVKEKSDGMQGESHGKPMESG